MEVYVSPFSSKDEVIENIETISAIPNFDPNIEANIIPEICIHHLIMYPLHQLIQNISEYETMQIIHDTDFVSFFQPIVSLQNNDVIGFEALLRDPLSRVSPRETF